jgi:Uma2 family endonuclease
MATEVLTETLPQASPTGMAQPLEALPPLENGDHLTRSEFERRYDAMPHVKKAELIEGVVYMPSPVRVRSHGKPHGQIMSWVGVYCSATPGVDFADNATLRLDPDNEPQPDAMLWIDEAAGGRARVSNDDYLEGAPELIVEVAASSASYDLHDKLNVYRRNGVPEYIVWRVYNRQVDWFRLENERYVTVPPDAAGIIRSRVFPGLHLAVTALINGDLSGVLAALQQGIGSAEHRAFVETLAEARRQKSLSK